MKPTLCLVTPALADANNGNWQTARRWARMLADDYRVKLLPAWQAEPADALIALHARRSAPSIAAWASQHPDKPLVVVLTGTDLYRDIQQDAAARHSLKLAHRLIVLHERGIEDLPAAHRKKAVVCFQSCVARKALAKSNSHLTAAMVGHLREEKDPRTYFAAARALANRSDIQLLHIGRSLLPELGQEAEALSMLEGNYAWLGELDPAQTRRHIQQAHVLVQPSVMEGGAHTVMEAIRSGTPVLASRIPGNVGMLGADYAGLFNTGDAAGLATLMAQCRDDPAMLPRLQAQCALRAPLFDPRRERQTLRQILADLLPA